MASLNTATKPTPIFTHEGAVAARITPLQELIRTTMSCMLWEDGFYEGGESIAERIRKLVHSVTLAQAAGVAIEARNNMKLRHVPLLIVRWMACHPKKGNDSRIGHNPLPFDPKWISETLAEVIQRPDELTEFLAIYWKDGKQPLSKQVKLGLAKAFQKFNEYSLAKYNRKKDVMLRDVLFLCHSKPKDVPEDAKPWDHVQRALHAAIPDAVSDDYATREDFEKMLRPDGFTDGELLYGKLIYDQLATPDTWEVELSQSTDKLASWERLLNEQKLGDLAFLRNLRNMLEVGISPQVLREHGDGRNWGRVLPFRFIAAARLLPQMEPHLERWMLKCMEGSAKLAGQTILLVDVSGSMADKLSAKSDLTRLDAAKALAILLREVCDSVRVVVYNYSGKEVPPRRGFALADAIGRPNGGTDTGSAVGWANERSYDRLIVITDEQSATRVPSPIKGGKGYFINVATNKNGIGYGPWLHIDGFSEAVVDYIVKYEESLK